MNGKYPYMLILTLLLITLPLAFADMEMEETGLAAQLNELLPFEHLKEGHWLAFTLSVILWISLIYSIYSVVLALRKKFS